MFIFTIGDLIGIFVLGLMVLILTAVKVSDWIKQYRCDHKTVFESHGCDAICSDCRKNLGFIGQYRGHNRSKMEQATRRDS